MSIVYALIARQQNVLCEYTDAGTGGNFQTVTRAVLKHLAQQDAVASESGATPAASPTPIRSVFPYNSFNFFFLHEDGLAYMCMAEEKVHANVAFSMLAEMKTLFLQRYAKLAKTAIAYGMAAFTPTIESLTKKYDNLKVDTALSQVRQKMEKVKMIMIENVNQLMEKGEKIDLLVLRTENLRHNALKYDKTAKKLKNVYWWKNVKYWLLIVFCVALLAFLISFMICGLDYSTCSSRISSKAQHSIEKELDRVSDKVSKGVTGGVTSVGGRLQRGTMG